MNTTPVQDSLHWATKLIGKPWVPEWHCWSLVRDVYGEQLGIPLPDFMADPETKRREIQKASLSPEWVELDGPEELCVVAMSRRNIFHHVGVYTEADGGLVVHVQEGTCTVADSLAYLQKVGWQRIGFFKWHTL